MQQELLTACQEARVMRHVPPSSPRFGGVDVDTSLIMPHGAQNITYLSGVANSSWGAINSLSFDILPVSAMHKATEKAFSARGMDGDTPSMEEVTPQRRPHAHAEAADASALTRSPKLAAKTARPTVSRNSTVSSASPSPSVSLSEASASSRSSASSSGRSRACQSTTSTGKKRPLGYHNAVETVATENPPHGGQHGAKRPRAELPSRQLTARMNEHLFALSCAQMRGRMREYMARENELDEELREQGEEEDKLRREINKLMREFTALDPEAAAAFEQRGVDMEGRQLKDEPHETRENQPAAAVAAPTDPLLPAHILEREEALRATMRERHARVKELAATLPRVRELANGQVEGSAWASRT